MTRAIRRHHRQRLLKRNRALVDCDAVWMYWGKSLLEMSKRIPSWFKTMRRRQRRAMDQQAMRAGVDPPRFRRDDEWAWW